VTRWIGFARRGEATSIPTRNGPMSRTSGSARACNEIANTEEGAGMSNGAIPSASASTARVQHSIFEHKVALFAVAIATALVTGFVIYSAMSFFADTGEEPPIRVKNGSLELHIVSGHHSWHKRGNDMKNWDITGRPQRGQLQLDLTLAVKPGVTCASQEKLGANTLTVTYTDRSTGTSRDFDVTIKGEPVGGSDKSTISLVSGEDLEVIKTNPPTPHQDQRLFYSKTGYISMIKADGAEMCRFQDASELLDLLIMDYWK
jgi:hypothetical protein